MGKLDWGSGKPQTLSQAPSHHMWRLHGTRILPFFAHQTSDLLARSEANKELNDKKRLATSYANLARSRTVSDGTCKFPKVRRKRAGSGGPGVNGAVTIYRYLDAKSHPISCTCTVSPRLVGSVVCC